MHCETKFVQSLPKRGYDELVFFAHLRAYVAASAPE